MYVSNVVDQLIPNSSYIMHPIIMATSTANRPKPTPDSVARCPVQGFPPSPWGDRFLDYFPDHKVIEAKQEIAKALKEEIKTELLSVSDKPLIEQVRLIDSIERLGVAYHFEEEIEDAMRHVHGTLTNSSSDDLLLTSLRFRLSRQHGFKISSDVFRKFVSSNGGLKEEEATDVQGMLSLYEACHVRVHEDDILDEVLPFTMSKLKSIQDQVSDSSLKERIKHALKSALHKRLTRFECVHYMRVYEEDDPLHNKSLLKFAKYDFNLLQASHRQELSEMCRWWKNIDLPSELPLRDRIVESYFLATSSYIEPQYSLARKITTMASQIMILIDDIYDSYAMSLEELEIFTQAIYRWDKSCLDQLSGELRWFYQTLILDAHDEIERHLAPIGRSQYVNYSKQEIKALVRTYLTEAKWRNKKYIPTLDEYMENDMYRNTGCVAITTYIFLGMEMVTHREFEWLCSLPKPVKSVSYLVRVLNDIGGNKFDENRGHSALLIEAYMKEYGLSYEDACEKLLENTHELWKDVNEGMTRPFMVPRPVINCFMNMTRAAEIVYDGAEDGFTLGNENMKHYINTFFVDSIPI